MMHPRQTLILVSACSLAGCSGDESGTVRPLLPPAHVDQPKAESELTLVRLTPDAVERLGIATDPVTRRPIPRRRVVGGVTVLPSGSALTLNSPFAAMVHAPGESKPGPEKDWRPGRTVAEGEVILTLEAVLSGDSRATMLAAHADATGAVAAAKVDVDAAEIAQDRARQLLRDQVGSQRAVDEATARLQAAQAARAAAQTRRKLLRGILDGSAAGALPRLALRAPHAGMLTQVFARPGSLVAAGAPLCEVTKLTRLWIRVPVFAGAATEIATAATALVGPASTATDRLRTEVRPIPAPPGADPAAGTIDLFYELGSAGTGLRPGEVLHVSLPLRTDAEVLVVPWSAILFDIHGNSWVYEETAAGTYTRRRVEIRRVADTQAVLTRGPEVGTRVVSSGAAELFGTEFEGGK